MGEARDEPSTVGSEARVRLGFVGSKASSDVGVGGRQGWRDGSPATAGEGPTQSQAQAPARAPRDAA